MQRTINVSHLITVCLVALLTASLPAGEEPSLLERQQLVLDQLDKLFEDDETWEIWGIVKNPDSQKLDEAINLLRDSESLFPESDEDIRRGYIYTRANFLLTAIAKTKDAKKKDALFDECIQMITMIAEAEEREVELEKIHDLRQYGNWDSDGGWTLEDALKIPKIEIRNRVLHNVAQTLSRQAPPEFDEAVQAARAICDIGNRELCLSIIAVRQARAGLFDDAETTYRLLTESTFGKISTLLTFALIHEERGEMDAAKKRIDDVFDLGYFARDGTFIPQFYRYVYSCFVLSNNPILARYLFDKLVAIQEQLDQEFAQEIAAYNERSKRFALTGEFHMLNTGGHRACKFASCLALAKMSAHLDDDNKAVKRYFEEVRTMIIIEERQWTVIKNHDRVQLIVALFDAGYDDEAQKELDEYVKLAEQRLSFDGNTPSTYLKDLVLNLTGHHRFAEGVSTAKAISDEKERFEAYDWIVTEVRFRLQNDACDLIQIDPLRKRFSSPQEILDIAEMLGDEPGGKSLEAYRAKIRKLAEKL